MLSVFRRYQTPVALLSTVLLTGCDTMDPAMMSSLPSDILSMRGNLSSLTSRPSSASDVLYKVQAAGAIIATVQRYAAISAAQRRQVEATVSRKYDGMVRQEKRQLAPKYASRKAEVRNRATQRMADARKKSPAAAAKVEAETKKEVAKVDLEWEKAAKSSVAKNYGTDFAVPVQNADGKAVVAFASVKESGVSVSDSSYVVNSSSGSLKTDSKISHSGKTYAVLK